MELLPDPAPEPEPEQPPIGIIQPPEVPEVILKMAHNMSHEAVRQSSFEMAQPTPYVLEKIAKATWIAVVNCCMHLKNIEKAIENEPGVKEGWARTSEMYQDKIQKFITQDPEEPQS